MKNLAIIIALLLMPVLSLAAEATIALDRCAILNSQENPIAGSKIALHFPLPEGLSQKDIIYAELVLTIPVEPERADSLLELRAFPLLASWQVNNITYEGSDYFTDSLMVGAFMVKLGVTQEFHIDITSYVKSLVADEQANNGLLIKFMPLGNTNVCIPTNQNTVICDVAQVRVTYK